MTDKQIISAVSYIYLKTELGKLAEKNHLSAEETRQIEDNIRLKLGIGSELCWV